MATLRLRNSTFYASFYDKSRRPKEKRVSLQTENRSAARAVLVQMERLWLTGEADPWYDDMHAAIRPGGNDLPLDEALDAFLKSRRDMGCTENTLRVYRDMKRALLRADSMRAYIFADGIAARTKLTRYIECRAFCTFALENGMMNADPLENVTKPKVDKKIPIPVTEADLIDVCTEIKKHYRRYRQSGEMECGHLLWKINAFWFSWLTGFRRSEIARLRWAHVNLEDRTVTLFEQKGRRQERVPISDKAASLLRRLPEGERKQFVFCSPGFTDTERHQRSFGNNLSATWRRFRREAGLDEKKSFHALRKGFCSELARNGANAHTIQRAARHTDISTSLKYVHLHDDTIRDALNEAFG